MIAALRRIVAIIAAAGLAMPAMAFVPRDSDVIWLTICGRPDMRVAMPIDRDEPLPDPVDCQKACHAAMSRKIVGAITLSGGRGARV